MRLAVLCLLLFSTLASARSGSGVLILRGRVPASTTIEWDKSNPDEPKVEFKGSKAKPSVKVSKEKDHRKITISHP